MIETKDLIELLDDLGRVANCYSNETDVRSYAANALTQLSKQADKLANELKNEISNTEPSDEELINYYARAVTRYIDDNGVSNRDAATVYGLRQVLRKWGKQ
jgi:hypothetical protein